MAIVDPLVHVRTLLDTGRTLDAAKSLSQAARAGDIGALYEFALWAVAGEIIPRDLSLAYNLLGRAKDGGHENAALLYAYFTAAGTGCNSQWKTAFKLIDGLATTSVVARRQIELLGQMGLDHDGEPTKVYDLELCSDRPRVAVCHQMLAAAECDYVIGVGAPHLTLSQVVDPQSGKLVPHPVRRSQGAMFGVYTEDLVVNAINRRIAAVSGTNYEQGEPLQLLHYRPGDEYKPHLDALPGEKNQRVLTVIVYLTNDYQGGETQFLRTGFSFKGKKGDALLFANMLPNGQPDPSSLHCGKPVSEGTKLIATRWIRQSRFTYPAPTPILSHLLPFEA